jgi:hypothetical protein
MEGTISRFNYAVWDYLALEGQPKTYGNSQTRERALMPGSGLGCVKTRWRGVPIGQIIFPIANFVVMILMRGSRFRRFHTAWVTTGAGWAKDLSTLLSDASLGLRMIPTRVVPGTASLSTSKLAGQPLMRWRKIVACGDRTGDSGGPTIP